MLIAAALLTASMHSLGVIEAPGVPPVPVARATAVATAPSRIVPLDDLTVVATSASLRRVGVDDLAVAHGRAFVEDLGALGPAALRRAATDRRVVAAVQDDPPPAQTVAQWWSHLPADEQGPPPRARTGSGRQPRGRALRRP
ncbi:hypothetical protein Q9Q99_18310 [Curtobacterium flaccumfaciens]|nr:hypothetical protein Q9Q99_18310 [Curtobacterium flaccumfaciens]